MSFAQESGYLRFNVGKVVKTLPIKNTLAARILSEAETHRMLALETDACNRALLTLLYSGSLRISEACDFTWRGLTERGDAGQATVYGKGGKTRVVLVSPNTWRHLVGLCDDANSDEPVFAPISSPMSGRNPPEPQPASSTVQPGSIPTKRSASSYSTRADSKWRSNHGASLSA